MNLLDVVVVAFAVLAGIGGYRAGLVARFLSWAGMAAGIAVGAKVLPWFVDRFGSQDARAHFVVATAVLLGGAFIGQALGMLLGARANLALPAAGRKPDRLAGSLAGILSVLVALWLLLPGLESASGELADQAARSKIARIVSDHSPDAPRAWAALRGLIDETGFPKVFESGATPDAGVPPTDTGVPQGVLDNAVASTVRVEGEACDRVQDGSGFTVEDDLIATNAHVVAGTRSLSVITRGGRRVPATVVYFDPDRDLALLRSNVNLSPLPLGVPRVGDSGAVLGYPGGGPLTVSPYKIFDDSKAVGRDLYDQHRTERQILILASTLHPGDSGSALIDARGQVVGVAFAIASDKPGTAYALERRELDAALAAPRSGAVSTGPCLTAG